MNNAQPVAKRGGHAKRQGNAARNTQSVSSAYRIASKSRCRGSIPRHRYAPTAQTRIVISYCYNRAWTAVLRGWERGLKSFKVHIKRTAAAKRQMAVLFYCSAVKVGLYEVPRRTATRHPGFMAARTSLPFLRKTGQEKGAPAPFHLKGGRAAGGRIQRRRIALPYFVRPLYSRIYSFAECAQLLSQRMALATSTGQPSRL